MITKIKTNIGTYVLRNYRGFVIESFNNAQLGDTDCKGCSYSIYQNEEHRLSGRDSLSVRESIWNLSEAKEFVGQMISRNDN